MTSNFSHTGFIKNDAFLVSKGDAALATGVLVDSANNDINLADGQLGVVCADYDQLIAKDTFLTATNGPSSGPNTVASVRKIKFVQGTPNSSDLSAQGFDVTDHPPYVSGWEIDGRQALSFSAKLAKTPSLSAFTIGDVTANAGSLVALNETEYTLRIGLTGVRKNREFSLSGVDTTTISFTTPNFTTLGTTNALDWLTKKSVYEINKRSNVIRLNGNSRRFAERQFVAFAIQIASGAGTGTGNSVTTAGSQSTAVIDIANGSLNAVSSIPVVYANGTTYSVPVTAQIRETFDNLIANSVITAASTVEVVNMDTAGAAAGADVIVIMGVDMEKARAFDDEPSVKVRLHVGLDASYNNPNILLTEASRPFEGEGDGERLYFIYQSNDGLNKYTAQNRPLYEEYLKPTNYIDQTASYDVFIIENQHSMPVQFSHTQWHPKRTFILVPAGETTTTGSLESIVKPWIESSTALERTTLDSTATGWFA
jgi:hypothetical protein